MRRSFMQKETAGFHAEAIWRRRAQIHRDRVRDTRRDLADHPAERGDDVAVNMAANQPQLARQRLRTAPDAARCPRRHVAWRNEDESRQGYGRQEAPGHQDGGKMADLWQDGLAEICWIRPKGSVIPESY